MLELFSQKSIEILGYKSLILNYSSLILLNITGARGQVHVRVIYLDRRIPPWNDDQYR